MEKDDVFSIFVSPIFPTWRTLKPEIVGNSGRVELSAKFQRLPLHFPPQPSSWSYCWPRPPADYLILTWRTLNRKYSLHLRNGKSDRRDSNGYPHIFHHAQFTKVTGDIVQQFLLPCYNTRLSSFWPHWYKSGKGQFPFPVTYQCRAVSAVAQLDSATPKTWVSTLEFHRYPTPLHCCYLPRLLE